MQKRAPKISRLASLDDVQVELRKIYRAGRRGDIETQDMNRFAAVLMNLVSCLRESDLEQRIASLEKQSDLPPKLRAIHG